MRPARFATIASLVMLPCIVLGQKLPLRRGRSTATEVASPSILPDAPGESSSASRALATAPFVTNAPVDSAPPIAPLYEKYILPGQGVRPLTARDKFLLGLNELRSPVQLVTITSAAAYEHATNGSPNYGTNLGAFGERVGAAAIRTASRTIFIDSLAAPLFHEDPRYYILGRRKNPLIRTGYAISRVFITRTDSGNSEPNYALFLGFAGVAGLNNAFYPDPNRGVSETAKGFAGSLGGAALGNGVREFLPDLVHLGHLRK